MICEWIFLSGSFANYFGLCKTRILGARETLPWLLGCKIFKNYVKISSLRRDHIIRTQPDEGIPSKSSETDDLGCSWEVVKTFYGAEVLNMRCNTHLGLQTSAFSATLTVGRYLITIFMATHISSMTNTVPLRCMQLSKIIWSFVPFNHGGYDLSKLPL